MPVTLDCEDIPDMYYKFVAYVFSDSVWKILVRVARYLTFMHQHQHNKNPGITLPTFLHGYNK